MKRPCWILFGAAAQVLFLVTVYQLFAFLYIGTGDLLGLEPLPAALKASRPLTLPSPPGGEPDQLTVWPGLAVDFFLLVQFGIVHSLFLYPAVRAYLERFLPREIYGSFYTVMVSASLMAAAAFWQPLPGIIYQAPGILAWFLQAGFLIAWAALFYSISLTGIGFQNGFTPWWAYLRGQPVPKRPLVTTGVYARLRHPIYLSFLGLMWLAPRMTTDHFLMATLWTVYVYVGSVLKDRRLLFFLGDRYRTYMASVPGYPLIPRGPLARVHGEDGSA